MSSTPREIEKQARLPCTICDPVERNMGWRVDALRDALRSAGDDGPGSTTDVRRQRRRFEDEVRASDEDAAGVRPAGHRPITDAHVRRLWLNWLLEGHPDLRCSSGRQPVRISGLVLYALAAIVAQVLEHTAPLAWNELAAH